VTGRHGQDELTVRVFRALYQEFDLHIVGDVHVVVPKGTLWFSGSSLGCIARQFGEHESRDGATQTSHAGTSEDGTPRP
jgi:hypothetical protein